MSIAFLGDGTPVLILRRLNSASMRRYLYSELRMPMGLEQVKNTYLSAQFTGPLWTKTRAAASFSSKMAAVLMSMKYASLKSKPSLGAGPDGGRALAHQLMSALVRKTHFRCQEQRFSKSTQHCAVD